MKITVEHEGYIVSVANEGAVQLEEALDMCADVLRGAGFFIDGDLIVEKE